MGDDRLEFAEFSALPSQYQQLGSATLIAAMAVRWGSSKAFDAMLLVEQSLPFRGNGLVLGSLGNSHVWL